MINRSKNKSPTENRTVDLALSTYEQALFQDIMRQKDQERARAAAANDKLSLSSLFSIFH